MSWVGNLHSWSPLFSKIVIHLDAKWYKGASFAITAENQAQDHPYVRLSLRYSFHKRSTRAQTPGGAVVCSSMRLSDPWICQIALRHLEAQLDPNSSAIPVHLTGPPRVGEQEA